MCIIIRVPILPCCACVCPSSCVHYSCEAIDCQDPLIRNAELKCSSLGFFNGARCTITCNSGYVLQVHRDDDIIKTQVCTQADTWAHMVRHTHTK